MHDEHEAKLDTHGRETACALRRPTALLALSAAFAIALGGSEAQAGCGCQKPPPLPAQVRPQVTFPGTKVTLFSSAFKAGQSYQVKFTSIDGTSATASATVVSQRDIADGVTKPLLPVVLPVLPVGPASIEVRAPYASGPVLRIADADFTVAPMPLAIPSEYGSWSFAGQRAAVDRDGIVYLSLDLTGLTQPLVFDAAAAGLPLRFEAEDVVFTNAQGYLMQLLVETNGKSPVPGMSVVPSTSATASDTMHYSRHEFHTYFLDHVERVPHAVSTDDSWHADGTRHVDHDHLILAIAGHRPDGTLLAPGATPIFELRLNTYSLFSRGLAAVSSVSLDGSSSTSSFDPIDGNGGGHGDVFTNGRLKMTGATKIDGSATAKYVERTLGTIITGSIVPLRTPATFMAVGIPTGTVDLGAIAAGGGATTTIRGPGSFKAASLTVNNGATLSIDNAAGPVTLYVTGAVTVSGGGKIQVRDPDPEKFAVYVSGAKPVTLSDAGTFYGVVYAPDSPITLTGGGLLTGAFVGNSVSVSNGAAVRYDETLRGAR